MAEKKELRVRERDSRYLERNSTVKEDKVLLLPGHTGISGGSLFLSPSGTHKYTPGAEGMPLRTPGSFLSVN